MLVEAHRQARSVTATAHAHRTPTEEPADAGRYSLRLLRGFELRCDDELVVMSMSAQRLAAFLALHDRAMLRVHIAGNLWIDSSEDQANASLRTALWRLRRAGPTMVDGTSTHLALSRCVPVDVQQTTIRAKRVLRGDPPDHEDLARLADAGELLPDWYDDWVVFERERLRQLCVHALERLSNDARAQGRLAQATEAGLAAVAFEPLRESAHRAVIEAHLTEGNAGEAIRQYQLFRDLLRTKLGLAPSQWMQDLVRPLGVVTMQ